MNNRILPDTISSTNVPQKQELAESSDIKMKPNLCVQPINSSNIPGINPTKLQQPSSNHFDVNMPLNVSIRLSDNMNERSNLIKCNLENQMEQMDHKFNSESLQFNSDIKQDTLKFPPQQEFKQEPIIVKQECPKIEKDCYGK